MIKTPTQPERLLETADVARTEGVVTATIRADVAAGRLRVAAITPRGTRLFRPDDVKAYSDARASRRRVRASRYGISTDE
jgi:hypothetical protein